jgi:uncharacterized protein YcbK (DUF882 family)
MSFFRYFILLILAAVTACTGTTYSPSHKDVSAYGMEKTKPDATAVRHIVLRYPYTHEMVNADYYHDGHYDSRVMKQINTLLRDRHADVVGTIDPELIDYLVDIRSRLGLPPMVVFDILSGYRTPETNRSLSFSNSNVAKESLHMHGWAVDFRVDHVNGQAICEIAKTMQRGGVAYYPKDNHVHIDLGNIRTWHAK